MPQLRSSFAITIIYLVLTSAPSRAELFFEPSLSYGRGSISSKDASGEGIGESVLIGPALGAKFGVFYDYLYLTLDVRAGLLNIEGQTTNSTIPLMNNGFSIGWDWNIPVRLTYTLDSSVSLTLGDTSVSASGSRLALGYYLDINTILSLELMSSKGTTTVDGESIDTSITAAIISISFPYEFLYPTTSWKEKSR